MEQSLKHILLLTLLLTLPLTLPLTAFTPYHIRNYTDKDGLSMNIGQSIVQDKKGYIWIATQQGLSRFDGMNFTTFTKKDGLPNSFINVLFLDRQNNLWIGARGGLALYKDGKFTPYTTGTDALFENNVNCIGGSTKYGILVGTAGGLFVIENEKLVRFPEKNDLLKKKIQAIAVDQNDRIYLGTPGDGVIVVDNNGKVDQITEKEGLVSNNINSFLVDGDGIWIGTQNGLTLYQNGNFTQTYKKEEGISNNNIVALFEDRKGNFWIGTTDGLNLKDGDNFITFDISDGLAGNVILSLCEDHEGEIWVGGYGGITYLGKSKFSTYTIKDGLPENNSYGIYEAKDGKFWVATYGGIAVIDDKDENNVKIVTHTTKDNELPSNTVRTIMDDQGKGESIWIGTAGGLARYKDNKFTVYNEKNDLPNTNVRVVYIDKKSYRLWLGMRDGGLVLFNKEQEKAEKIYQEKEGLLNNNVWFIKKDSKGNLWIGVDEGISRFDPEREEFTNYTKKDGLDCKDTHDILEDGEGYWIATFGSGLYYFNENQPKGKQFKQYTTDDGLPDNYIYRIMPDEEDGIWLPTNKGVCRWNKKWDEEGKFVITTYTVNDGLPSNENNAHGGLVDSRGRIWFSTPKGVAWIDPENIPKNEIAPPVYVEQLKVDKETVDIHEGDKISLDPNPQNVYIKFTALSYRFPEGVKFKIRLDGFHKPNEWFEPLGNNRFVEYTNLPPGDYTFRVKAANSDGFWNEKGASLAFTIKPSFFQTILFYVVLGMVILVLVAGYIQNRTAQQRKRRKELKQRVEERTRELKETQAQLIQQGKMASLGEMAAGLAHEMNNPANYIYGNADYLQRYIEDVRSVLIAYMKLDLPEEHKIQKIREELDIDKKLEELGGLVKYVKEGATRISDIVSDLRFFVGKDEPELQKIDIHKNIETTLNLLHNKTKDRIEVKKEFGKIPEIEGSSSQLNQVFMNILSNAADAIPEKGMITIETGMKDSNNLIVKISDTGEGISPENLPRIFDPFFTTRTKEQGMGLGLSITHRIIERHKGMIVVASQVGEGTTFELTIPIKQDRIKKNRFR